MDRLEAVELVARRVHKVRVQAEDQHGEHDVQPGENCAGPDPIDYFEAEAILDEVASWA